MLRLRAPQLAERVHLAARPALAHQEVPLAVLAHRLLVGRAAAAAVLLPR